MGSLDWLREDREWRKQNSSFCPVCCYWCRIRYDPDNRPYLACYECKRDGRRDWAWHYLDTPLCARCGEHLDEWTGGFSGRRFRACPLKCVGSFHTVYP
jgi:hypothetical protein